MTRPVEIVSSDLEQLILVDPNDTEIGSMTKLDCHQGDGVLHRAFSVFVFNSRGDTLLQQRSKLKMLWPGYWSNACCSHPRVGEDSKEAAQRRLKQELGLSMELNFLYKFQYQAHFADIGSEHELCWVWLGISDSENITANQNEIADWRFFSQTELEVELGSNSDAYTPWMKLEWRKIMSKFAHLVPKQSS